MVLLQLASSHPPPRPLRKAGQERRGRKFHRRETVGAGTRGTELRKWTQLPVAPGAPTTCIPTSREGTPAAGEHLGGKPESHGTSRERATTEAS